MLQFITGKVGTGNARGGFVAAAFILFAILFRVTPVATAQVSPTGTSPKSVPYQWHNVVMGGGGFVTGLIFHPHARDLLYARTDVGGAYRWDSTAERWVPITDWIGLVDVNLTGIESLALDPSDSNRVYLAAGTYTRTPAAILRSTDQGRNFERVSVPFTMGANESGRFNGERLAVDPNDGAILFFGSRRDGLWKSSDYAATWQRVEGFPATGAESSGPGASGNARSRGRGFGFTQPVGIVCVGFDPDSGKPGAPTPTIYAEVSATTTNLFRSTDAGVTWQAVPNQPRGFRPNHLVRAPDGVLYLSYGREPGPNTMTDGAVWKLDPKNDAWTDITPHPPATADQPFGYGDVAVDAQHPSTIMVTTFCHWHPHDEIFRSTNGGASWAQLWTTNSTEWDHALAPYTATRSPHWMGCIAINPFNANDVLFTTGFGIWSCANVGDADRGKNTRWAFADRGLEETVPLALISPPEGAHLLSGVGDIDGFRHDNLDESPAEGTFAGPRFSNTECLAFAWKKPLTIVRVGTGSEPVHAALSLDGGKNWTALGSDPPDNNQGAGTVAISADGETIVWTPRRGLPMVTTDRGMTWKACDGLGRGLAVIADTVNPARFYAFDTEQASVLASTNGAVSFDAIKSVLPSAENFGGGFGGSGGSGATFYATPEMEGDLWLAFRTAGLYHSRNGGVTFVKITGVAGAMSLGFGKPATGQKDPALFMAGTVAGLQALFRSDDHGESWVRINDDRHQYGWVSHVTGDPRIYGRVYFGTGGRGVLYGDPQSP